MIVGDNYYGKVDHLPGLFFVKTRFLHVWWIPLVPRESYVMVDGPGREGHRGVRIPFCWRSCLWGWARAFLLMASLWGLFAGVMFLWAKPPDGKSPPVGLSAGFLAFSLVNATLFLHFRRARPPDRGGAERLGKILGIPPEVIEEHIK